MKHHLTQKKYVLEYDVGGLMKKFFLVIIMLSLIGLAGCTLSLDLHPQGKSSSSTK